MRDLYPYLTASSLMNARERSRKALEIFINAFGEDEFKKLARKVELSYMACKQWRQTGINFNFFMALQIQKSSKNRIQANDISQECLFYKNMLDEDNKKNEHSA